MTASHEIVFGSTALEQDALAVRRMEGVEAISRLFEFELILETKEPDDLADDEIDGMLAKTAYIAFGAAREHRIWGALRSIEMLSVASANEHFQYRVIFVPRVWTLTLTCKSRVYLDLRAPEIAKRVFQQNAMAEAEQFRLSLSAQAATGDGSSTVPSGIQGYPVRPYTVQYNESDWAFVARLLEDEGISFYFEHTDDDGDQLVIVDANATFPELNEPASVSYSTLSGYAGGVETLQSLSRQQQLIPKKIHLREHHWTWPRHVLAGAYDIDAEGRGEHIRFGDGFTSFPEGTRLARVRGEEIKAGKVVYRGRSNLAGLRAGHRFTLHGHPMPELTDLQLLVTRVHHRAVQPGTGQAGGEAYFNEIEAIPAAQPFRPARITPKPKIHGVMTATIYGPQPGTAAPIDANGSYLVQLPFDPEPTIQGATSTRIRMLQAFAGNTHGIHYPLHIGTEVMIAHIDGDPDRPVIVGAVPNSETQSPVTSANPPTESIVKTRSGIQIELEDDA